jgi:hypothetical protein
VGVPRAVRHVHPYTFGKVALHPIDNRVSVGGDLVQVDFDIIDIGEIVEVDPGISGKGSRGGIPVVRA